MKRIPILTLIMSLAAGSALAQTARPPNQARGTYLGVLFGPLDEAIRGKLPPGCGVRVTHVLPDSPAAQAGLRREDVLLSYDGEKIRDGDKLVQLIHTSKPEQVVKLLVVRGDVTLNLSVKLGLGPVLRLARSAPAGTPGVAKPNGPSPLTVTAVPMERNRLKITFEFPDAGRIRSVDCIGDAAEIDRQVRELPPKVQNLAASAVRRLRDLELQKSEATPTPRER